MKESGKKYLPPNSIASFLCEIHTSVSVTFCRRGSLMQSHWPIRWLQWRKLVGLLCKLLSGYIIVSFWEHTHGRSLTCKLKRSGPNMDPLWIQWSGLSGGSESRVLMVVSDHLRTVRKVGLYPPTGNGTKIEGT